MKNLQAELAELREGYESVQGTLEIETLSKVDLQNKCQSLREELLFNKKIYEEVGSIYCTMLMSRSHCYVFLFGGLLSWVICNIFMV